MSLRLLAGALCGLTYSINGYAAPCSSAPATVMSVASNRPAPVPRRLRDVQPVAGALRADWAVVSTVNGWAGGRIKELDSSASVARTTCGQIVSWSLNWKNGEVVGLTGLNLVSATRRVIGTAVEADSGSLVPITGYRKIAEADSIDHVFALYRNVGSDGDVLLAVAAVPPGEKPSEMSLKPIVVARFAEPIDSFVVLPTIHDAGRSIVTISGPDRGGRIKLAQLYWSPPSHVEELKSNAAIQ